MNEEASKNKEFRMDMYEHKLTESEKKQQYDTWINKISAKPKEENVPKCPTCGSTDIGKISVSSKVVGASMFGLFSKTARSQFKCNKCGYKW